MKASVLEKKFDGGVGNIMDDVKVSCVTPLGREQRRVSVELPLWVVESLDREANRIGVTRQSIIKMLIAERRDRAS